MHVVRVSNMPRFTGSRGPREALPAKGFISAGQRVGARRGSLPAGVMAARRHR